MFMHSFINTLHLHSNNCAEYFRCQTGDV